MNTQRMERLAKKYGNTNHNGVAQPKTFTINTMSALRAKSLSSSDKPKNMGYTIKRLLDYLENDKKLLITAIACILFQTIATLAGSYMIRPIINTYITPKNGQGDLHGLANSLVILAFIYVSGVILQYLQLRIMVGVSQRSLVRLRRDLYNKLLNLPIRFFDTNSSGDIMSRFTNDVDAVGEMLNTTIVQLVAGTITLIGTLGLMIYTNIWLTLITLVMIPIFTYASRSIIQFSRKPYSQQQTALGILDGFAQETINGQKVVKVFTREEIVKDEFKYLNDDLRRKQIVAQFRSSIMGPVTHNLSNFSYALTTGIGSILCITQGFDIGGLTVFVNYTRQFSRPINEISMQMNTVFAALAGAERVFELLDEPPEPPDAPDCVNVDHLAGHVVMSHVNFGYYPDKLVLHDISLYAKPGQKIAFVGSTGAGKTTITNLLTRFYDIQSGEITIDGIPIDKIQRKILRRNIAMVLQDTHLFTGTVRENIRYGRLDATDDDVITAAKVANAHSFIMHLEKGYDTMLENDGANLSQGQRQLLNIARASISKAPILILDEATSSVDTRTERHIEKGMDALMSDRTTFVIAHRLSTVRNANAIMVLEKGEIIERGDHDDLLQQRGRYYELYSELAELD
ncbi:MAG TPA: ABC transporter ATP-binding protein [Flexilinea sp.]|nr:ABC transporter ATP-binding protein [Flexilinea sp.]HPJ64620.1 ABC transporter ATP-binding protein [Flexilinea sp.]HPR70197.1 ABC transporter ATP-binding protein [Flexilinea sp.]HQF80456.1 ABC transporter ATP-binding protein [Flexilinea sp.]HQG88060.1 ABC transporter ATP-binding protein [Flexilinea sp.]